MIYRLVRHFALRNYKRDAFPVRINDEVKMVVNPYPGVFFFTSEENVK